MKGNSAPIPILLTVREVSQILRIHRPKVYDLIKSGEIEGFKIGADWRIKRQSIERYVGEITHEMLRDILRDIALKNSKD